jgi:hypothetical protein
LVLGSISLKLADINTEAPAALGGVLEPQRASEFENVTMMEMVRMAFGLEAECIREVAGRYVVGLNSFGVLASLIESTAQSNNFPSDVLRFFHADLQPRPR